MERFYSKIEKTDTCWLWKAGQRGNGYGAIKVNGKTVLAHRFSYELHKGEIPNGLYVCHSCDVRSCVNPDHLWLGTQKDNMMDARVKGRLYRHVGIDIGIHPPRSQKNSKITRIRAVVHRGENVGFKSGHIPTNAKITRERAAEIKEAIKNKDCPLRELSVRLGVSYQMLKDMNRGRSYSMV